MFDGDVAWLAERGVRTLNVAGNRESRELGIGARIERFMQAILARAMR